MPSKTGKKPQRREQAQKYHELMSTPIYRLPAELIVNICERIDLVNFPGFMLATWHLLRFRGVIPAYPTTMLKALLLREDKGSIGPNLGGLPAELRLSIGQTLSSREKVHLILATQQWRPEEYAMIARQQ
ncbi:MAG: hypothetical protein L6R35_002058 [Caloplaca aegaea]|nr:MAG: hypothetical protein L6R35_002058 [Caloplaca aegaea]